MRRQWRIQHGGYAWESRRKGAEEALCIRYVHLSGRLQANVQHCTWSRNRARPAGRFSEMKAEIAKERTARLLRFPGRESRTLPMNVQQLQRGKPSRI